MCTVKNKTGDTDREVSSGNGDRLHVERWIHRGSEVKDFSEDWSAVSESGCLESECTVHTVKNRCYLST